MGKVYAYLRVSTARQAVEGESLDSQKAKVKAYCELHGHELAMVFVERGISGRKMSNRPELRKALDAVCAGGGILVCYSLSRLARSTKDAIDVFERINKAGGDLVLLNQDIDTSKCGGRLVFKIMAALAEYESEIIGERVKDIWDFKKGKGEKLGGRTPFGFNVQDGKLISNPGEQRAITLMEDLRGRGRTLREVAWELELRGIKTKTGRSEWAGKVIRGILREAQQRRKAKQNQAA